MHLTVPYIRICSYTALYLYIYIYIYNITTVKFQYYKIYIYMPHLVVKIQHIKISKQVLLSFQGSRGTTREGPASSRPVPMRHQKRRAKRNA